MQMDAVMAAILGVGTSIFSVGLAWGLISQRVSGLEEKVLANKNENEKKHDSYVTFVHFDAVTGPIRLAIDTMQRDIKEILKAVRNN